MHSEPKKYAKRLVDAVTPCDEGAYESSGGLQALERRPRALLSEEFEALCLPRVKAFVALYPVERVQFQSLGSLA